MTLAEWLDRLRTELGDDPRLALSPEEERLLLELARVAAHSSERIAAPLTTFLAGVALGDAPSPDREERLRRMVDALS
ncbi:MAG TPA: DUF6457 domain-containing protein [Candidatus Limnocylindria bacterium]|jgi:alpha-D-ribose 1-methylphosphonate 5-triphosphate diphosphatase PhnM